MLAYKVSAGCSIPEPRNEGMAPDGLTGMASTIGTAAVPAATVAILMATLGWDDLAFAKARGGGPLYFSVAECKKAHCLALMFES